jgi:ribonucleoside-diphosphate reductase alpha chain
MNKAQEILSDLTVHMKYAKYVPELNRRETWDELVTRNKDMHISRFPQLREEIENININNLRELILEINI